MSPFVGAVAQKKHLLAIALFITLMEGCDLNDKTERYTCCSVIESEVEKCSLLLSAKDIWSDVKNGVWRLTSNATGFLPISYRLHSVYKTLK